MHYRGSIMHYLLLLNNFSAELQENINWKPHYYIKKKKSYKHSLRSECNELDGVAWGGF